MALFVLISIFFILAFLSSEEENNRILDTIFKLAVCGEDVMFWRC